MNMGAQQRPCGGRMYDQYTTAVIRRRLGISFRRLRGADAPEVEVYRVLRLIIDTGATEHMRPLQELRAMESVDARIQCAEAHVLNELHLQDSSLHNLKYRPREDNICAVLNDWDLAFDSDARMRQTLTGLEKTGTGPYIATGTGPYTATDLLTPGAMRGEVHHLYRHDLEAFFYILIWVMCRYNDGKRLSPLPKSFTTWTHGTMTACADSKNTFLAKGWLELTPIASWGKLAYYIADGLRPYFYNCYRVASERESRWASEKAAAMFEGNEPPILERELDEPRKVWEEFFAVVKKAIARAVSAHCRPSFESVLWASVV